MARPIAADYEDKRQGLLAPAAQVFAEHGFDRASMVQVAKAGGVSKATIYHYYASKDDLLFDILESYLRGLRDAVLGLDLSEQSPEGAFLETVTQVLLCYQGADTQHRLQIDTLGRLAPDRQKVLRRYQSELVRFMSARLVAVSPDLHSEPNRLRAVTMSVFGMLNWHYMWNGAADGPARRDYAQVVAGLVLDGVRGMGALPPSA